MLHRSGFHGTCDCVVDAGVDGCGINSGNDGKQRIRTGLLDNRRTKITIKVAKVKTCDTCGTSLNDTPCEDTNSRFRDKQHSRISGQ